MGERLLLRDVEAAERLSLSRATVWKLMASGELRSVHVGRARRIVAADLDRWLAQRLAEDVAETSPAPPAHD
ncbi:MAG: helix-turn-helix domain-containing protein [Chloroflexota bacterium]|nr:helix-turn-helix domain-containing protein [Chloroflexota bacterium]